MQPSRLEFREVGPPVHTHTARQARGSEWLQAGHTRLRILALPAMSWEVSKPSEPRLGNKGGDNTRSDPHPRPLCILPLPATLASLLLRDVSSRLPWEHSASGLLWGLSGHLLRDPPNHRSEKKQNNPVSPPFPPSPTSPVLQYP